MNTKTITQQELLKLLNNNETIFNNLKQYLQDIENIQLIINDNVIDSFNLKIKEKQYIKKYEVNNLIIKIYDFSNYLIIIEKNNYKYFIISI